MILKFLFSFGLFLLSPLVFNPFDSLSLFYPEVLFANFVSCMLLSLILAFLLFSQKIRGTPEKQFKLYSANIIPYFNF